MFRRNLLLELEQERPDILGRLRGRDACVRDGPIGQRARRPHQGEHDEGRDEPSILAISMPSYVSVHQRAAAC
jgi:hypothetical protein